MELVMWRNTHFAKLGTNYLIPFKCQHVALAAHIYLIESSQLTGQTRISLREPQLSIYSDCAAAGCWLFPCIAIVGFCGCLIRKADTRMRPTGCSRGPSFYIPCTATPPRSTCCWFDKDDWSSICLDGRCWRVACKYNVFHGHNEGCCSSTRVERRCYCTMHSTSLC